jgi:L-2-hydroxyglutarate oxidase
VVIDYLIVGCGVIGLNVALEIKRRQPKARVHIIEKESKWGTHASGRNSGVLHAGFYYTADSLKAKFTRDGNQEMVDYCQRKKLDLNTCGKLVVPTCDDELTTLDLLLQRGKQNGVELHELDEHEAKKIEARARVYKRAIWSPHTSTVSPQEIMNSLMTDALKIGINIHLDCAYISHEFKSVQTTFGIWRVGYLINTAGLYADKIAHDYELGLNYRIMPFKGLYLYSDEEPGSLATNIYPVPNINNPFLGVHFTVTAHKEAKMGPTAIPCFWREQYGLFDNFKFNEFLQVGITGVSLFKNKQLHFAQLALEEVKKYWKPHLIKQGGLLLDGVERKNYRRWSTPGIRAQLIDTNDMSLVMDFCLEKNDRSAHVLNSVSPAFTCSMPLARYICDEISV